MLGVKDKVLVAEEAAGVASVGGAQGLPCAKAPIAKAKPFGGVCGTCVQTHLRQDRRTEGRGNRGNKQRDGGAVAR